jgi:hypothetical protein
MLRTSQHCHQTKHPYIPLINSRILRMSFTIPWRHSEASPVFGRLAVLYVPNRVHFLLRSVSFFLLLPNPPHGECSYFKFSARITIPAGQGLPPRRVVTLHNAPNRSVGAKKLAKPTRLFGIFKLVCDSSLRLYSIGSAFSQTDATRHCDAFAASLVDCT